MTEADIKSQIRRALGRMPDVKLFNNPVGEGWIGKVIEKDQATVTLLHPRHVTFGLFPGSSDLIGWRAVTVTPEMVGRRVAVFTSPEVKKPGRIRFQDGQENWLRVVGEAGGIAGVVQSAEDALRLVSDEGVLLDV